MFALMLAGRHNCTSPGRIWIVGFNWPLTVRLVGSPPSTTMTPASPPATWGADNGWACEWYQYVPGLRDLGNR